MLAYLVLLRAEIARFTRTEPARLCCSDPHLRPLAGLSVERCYLLRCPVQSGRSSSAAFRPVTPALRHLPRPFGIAPATAWPASQFDYHACPGHLYLRQRYDQRPLGQRVPKT